LEIGEERNKANFGIESGPDTDLTLQGTPTNSNIYCKEQAQQANRPTETWMGSADNKVNHREDEKPKR